MKSLTLSPRRRTRWLKLLSTLRQPKRLNQRWKQPKERKKRKAKHRRKERKVRKGRKGKKGRKGRRETRKQKMQRKELSVSREKIQVMKATIRELEKSNLACKIQKLRVEDKLSNMRRRENKLIAKLDRLRSESTRDSLEDTTEPLSELEDNAPQGEIPSCHPKFSEAVANASNRFSIGMYKEVLKEKSPKGGMTSLVAKLLGKDSPGENLVMSASSVSTVLAMLKVGARGATLEQMTNSLFLPHGRVASIGYRCLLSKLYFLIFLKQLIS